jgi:hypothetical protein
MTASNIHSGISSVGELLTSSCTQRKTLLPPRRPPLRTNTRCPYHGCQRYCTSQKQVLWVSCTPVVQPGTPTQFVGIPDAGGIRNRLCKCGKQKALSTFAQPRLLRSKFAAQLKPEYSHLPGLTQGGSSLRLPPCRAFGLDRGVCFLRCS